MSGRTCLFSRKSILVTASVLIMVALLLTGVYREISLEQAQRNFTALLEQEAGNYNENRVVLSSTTKQEAESMAEEFRGTLRITDDGRFAVINLPEGMTLSGIAEEDDFRKYHDKILLDYNNFSVTDVEIVEEPEVRTNYQVSDPMFPQQTYLDYLNIGDTWTVTQGADARGQKITVAIIDTGIDTDHPEFYGADGNSIISTSSYDATNDKVVEQDGINVIEDNDGHGTGVAGIIAAQMNETGIAGIAPEVELLIIKCDTDEAGEFKSSADIVFAIYYAIEMDVDVINMSLGGTNSTDMIDALQLAVDSDIICIAAAGNDSTDTPHYPAAYNTVIGVGALADGSWEIADYSNYGPNSDIMAPGTTLTATIGGGYTYLNGTSMAAPMVSAAAALYVAQNKYATYEELRADMLAAGKDLGDLGEDYYYGFGALDVHAFICDEKGTITYDYCTEDIVSTTQVFVRQHTIQTVPEPERDKIIFDDWYYDKAYTRVFDYDAWYSTEFVEDVTLYAKWVNEDDEDASVYNYKTLSDGTIEIVSYKGKRRYLTIPNEIDGKIVSSIGPSAFAGNTRLREVVFPEGLVYIKSCAFSGVNRMREITFTGTRLTEIQEEAFQNCSSLRKLDLPDSVRTIGVYAFSDCTSMAEVNISENSSLAAIGEFAFSNAAISNFYIPQNVTADGFDGSALAYCARMRSIAVHPGNVAFIVDGSTLYNTDRTALVYYPAALTGNYTVADSVQSIGQYAFAESAISEIVLNKVESIRTSAFKWTKKLTSVVIPDTVTVLENCAFAFSSIRQVTLSENLTVISDGVFMASNLSTVHIPSKVQTIDSQAFMNCSYLQVLTFTEDSVLERIKDSAFQDCTILGNFMLPRSLRAIEEKAFSNCRAITEIEIPSSIDSIGQYAFQRCSLLRYVVFDDGCMLTQIPDYCFAYCTMLNTVDFSDGITVLGDYAFIHDYLLQTLNFGENSCLTTVGDSCFNSCSALQTMQLPETVTTIGQFAYAFSGLTQIDLSSNVTSIGNGAFGACYMLTGIAVDNANANYTAVDNVLFSRDITTVYCVPASRAGSYTLPETVKVTAPYSFYYDRFLTSVILPAGLEDIQQNSFYNCSSLSGIEIPACVTNIGRQAFENCFNLKSVVFVSGSKLERLGIYTFVNCGLSKITIPASTQEIAQYVFYNCNNLKNITFEKNSRLSYIPAYLFKGTKVQNIVFEAGSALTSIQAHAFDGAPYLKHIDFGNAQITNVDNYAFYGCKQLESIDIPDTVTYIGRYAFYGCAKLDRIDLPAVVEYIGESAFYGTSSIKVFFAADELPVNVQTGWDKGVSGYFLGASDYVVTDEWEYSVRSDGTIALAMYKGNAAELTIDTLDGYTVSKIGTGCFTDYDTLTSVILSEYITEIGNYAFSGCDGLSAITIPASVERIGDFAFADCAAVLTLTESSSLKTIGSYAFAGNATANMTLPDTVTDIGNGAFLKSKLTDLTIGENSSLKAIGQQAFIGSGITSIYLPASLESVGAEAFKNVTSLTAVEIADGETALKLSNSAFEGCGIGEISIPARVYYIGEYTFGSCPNLQNIHVDTANTSYTSQDGILCDIYGTTLIQYPSGRSGAYEIPSQFTVLTYASFKNTKELTEVTFAEGSSVKTIGWQVFSGCDSLKKISVPDTVVSFDFYAFENCTALTDVILGEGTQLSSIYEGAFYGCSALTNITLPDAVVEVGAYAFYNCTSLTEIPMTESAQVKGIYDYAFCGCSGITEIPVFTHLVEIGEYAFAYTNIAEFTVSARVKEISPNAFAGCENIAAIYCDEANSEYVSINGALYEKGATGMNEYDALVIWPNDLLFVLGEGKTIIDTSDTKVLDELKICKIKIADTVTQIADNAFYGNKTVRSVWIPDTVTTLNYSAFANCSMLNNVRLPENLTLIPDRLFEGCVRLSEIKLPDSVTTINRDAFSGCTALKNVYISKGVTTIEDNAFDGCVNLEQIHFAATAMDDLSMYSNVFRNVGKNLEQGTKVTIGANVTRIPAYLFYAELAWCGKDTQNLYSISFEKGSVCTEVGQFAFAENIGLASVELPDGLEKIGNSVFEECDRLLALTIPESVTKIGSDAFGGSDRLTVMYPTKDHPREPSSTVGASSCENVRSYGITEDGQFYCITNDDKVIVSKYFGEATELVIPAEIEGYPVTEIAIAAYYRNNILMSVVIPDSVTRVGYWSFSQCRSLLCVLFPESVTHIDNYVFSESNPQLLAMFKGDSLPSASSTGWNYPAGIIMNVVDYGVSDSDFFYCVTADGSATAGAYLGENSYVEIPETILNYPVTSISNTFANKNDLVGYIIPDSVTQIGPYAFYQCTKLTEISIPEQVTKIGRSAFEGCSNLSNLTIPEQVASIDEFAFAACSKLEQLNYNAVSANVNGSLGAFRRSLQASSGIHVVIGSNVVKIPDGLFANSSVVDVVFEEESNCTSIGNYVFRRTDTLKEITLPNSVTTIGYQAFFSCKGLEKITIPESVKEIGTNAFGACASLTSAGPIGGGYNYEFGWTEYIPKHAFHGCESLAHITIPESVTSFGLEVFSSCNGLISAGPIGGGYNYEFGWTDTIPDNAFSDCNSLTSITIPESISTIGHRAFSGCTKLTGITIPKGVTKMGADVFRSCNWLISAGPIGGGYDCEFGWIDTIPENAFSNCSSLTSITIPEGIETIEKNAFSNCSQMTSIYFKGDAPKIDPTALSEVTATAYYPASNETWVDIVKYNYGGTITWVPYESGSHIHSYETVVTPPTCTEQGYTTHTCSCGDSYIDTYTDTLSHSWDDGVITQEPTEEAEGLRMYTCTVCTQTKYESIPVTGHVHSFESVVTNPTCTEEGYTTYTCSCGDSYVDSYTEATGHRFGEWHITRAPTCMVEGEECRECTKCDHFELRSVIALGHSYTSNVTPPTCTEGGFTTYTCSSCGEIYIAEETMAPGHNYTSVITAPTCYEQGYTTYTCTVCGHSYVDNHVDIRHSYGIWYTVEERTEESDGVSRRDCELCDGYETRACTTLYSGECGETANWSITSDGTLWIAGSGAMNNWASNNLPVWRDYYQSINHIIIEAGISNVGTYAFYFLRNVTDVILPDTITTIDNYAFSHCTKLPKIILSSGLTRINRSAFESCEWMELIVVPEGVTHIEDNAFSGCDRLKVVWLISPSLVSRATKYYSHGFLYYHAQTIVIPAQITEVGSYITTNYTVLENLMCEGTSYIAYSNHTHDWVAGVTEHELICSSCSLEKQLHSYESVVTNPTCTEQGYTTHTCSVCGDTYVDSYADALGHNFAGGTCTRCGEADPDYVPNPVYTITYTQASISLAGDIGLNYYATLSEDLMADEEAYMIFTVAGEEQIVPISEAIISTGKNGELVYRFSCAVPARMMSEQVVAQMYASDCTAVGEAKAFSVKAYCDKAIAAYGSYASYTNLVNLMKAMLNYGGYSQIKFGYNTGNLANADLEDKSLPNITAADLASFAHGKEGAEAGINIQSVSLLLESTTTIRFYFKLDGSKPIESYTFVVDGEVVEPVLYSGTTYYVDKVGVPARELDVNSYVEVGGLRVWYCGMSYVRQILNSSTDAALINACKALYAYSEAANAYFK